MISMVVAWIIVVVAKYGARTKIPTDGCANLIELRVELGALIEKTKSFGLYVTDVC
jgi:hypothetical protein